VRKLSQLRGRIAQLAERLAGVEERRRAGRSGRSWPPSRAAAPGGAPQVAVSERLQRRLSRRAGPGRLVPVTAAVRAGGRSGCWSGPVLAARMPSAAVCGKLPAASCAAVRMAEASAWAAPAIWVSRRAAVRSWVRSRADRVAEACPRPAARERVGTARGLKITNEAGLTVSASAARPPVSARWPRPASAVASSQALATWRARYPGQ